MQTLVRVSTFLFVATAAIGCAEDPAAGPDPAALATKMYPGYVDKLALKGQAVVEKIVAQTDFRLASNFSPGEWYSLGWLPLPGGLMRSQEGRLYVNANAAVKWPPRPPTEDGPADQSTEIAVLLVTSRVGDRKATYQSLLIHDPTKGDTIVDPFLASIKVNTPRAVEVDLEETPTPTPIPGRDEFAEAKTTEKQAFACDGQTHRVNKLVFGTPLTATCASVCDDDYAKFTSVAEAAVTVTCPAEANCKPTNIKREYGARIDLEKFHDQAMTDKDNDDSTYITWNTANGQLECDYAWPCSRDFIGVTWEGKTAAAEIYDDADTPELVGAAATTAAHAAVTSHGNDVYFEPLSATAWALLITQAASTLVMAGTSFFSLSHSAQIQAHHKIPDAHAIAIAICDPTKPVLQPMQPVANAVAQ